MAETFRDVLSDFEFGNNNSNMICFEQYNEKKNMTCLIGYDYYRNNKHIDLNQIKQDFGQIVLTTDRKQNNQHNIIYSLI